MKQILLAFGCAIVLRADSQHILRASFPDGTGIEIFTQSTGSTQVDGEGMMGIWSPDRNQAIVNRVVMDSAKTELFAYILEASRGANPNTTMIRIKPITELSTRAAAAGQTFPGGHLPTVAGVREFPAVKIGEVVTLDILYNPSTGEKIYDVLKPIAAATSGLSVTAARASETISLKDIALRVNGRAMSAPVSWAIGAAVRIDIPGHGTYVVAAYDPHETSPNAVFAAVAQADGKTLSWTMGKDRVEITSTTNVLPRSGKGALWVSHDPHYQPDVVGVQAADTVEWLLPKK